MKFFVKSLTYLLSVQVLSLVLMSLFRILFYVSVRPQLPPEVAAHAGWTARAFLNGLWFDNVIACYVMALPLVITVVTGLLSWWRPWLLRAYGWWFGVMYALVFMASAGNIPYFSYFSKPLNASIWNWADYGGTTLGMIFGEPAYYLYIAAYFIILGIFSYGLYTLRRRIQQQVQRTSPAIPYSRTLTWRYLLSVSGLSIALLGACFLGIRGRLGYNPIKVSAAYFCTNPVLNNLGVNPMFCLLTSTLDDMRPENKQLRLMPDAEAIRRVQHYYQRTGIEGISPIARPITPDSLPTKRNLPESFNHIPLFIHGEGLSPREISNFAGQVDVAPTLLGLLRVPYVQNNFGIDLLREQRPAAFYTADKTIAARNATHLYVYNAETDREYCYRLDPQGTPTEAPACGAEWQPLKDYVFSLLQTTEYMVQHGMTTDRPAQQPAGEK